MEGLKKGPWSKEEDEILLDYVKNYGAERWSSIQAKGILRRDGKSCYFHWKNKLQPGVKKQTKLSEEEKKIVLELQSKIGNKWTKIASYLPGRTDNDVKNFWNATQKKLSRQRERATFGDMSNNVKNNENADGESCSFRDPIVNTEEGPVMAAQLTSDKKEGYSETPQDSNWNEENEFDLELYLNLLNSDEILPDLNDYIK